MDIWEIDKVFLFLILILPGFISLKIYGLIVAGERRDFSKSLVEAVCFSVLNFSALSWPILYISSAEFVVQHPFLYWLSLFFVFVGFPSFWPFLFLWISTFGIYKKYALSPYKQPWDYVFNRKEPMWVIIHLNSGKTLRGKFANKSFASSYPSERQIYLEELWRSGDNGGFKSKVPRTKGVIVSQDEIVHIEFYG